MKKKIIRVTTVPGSFVNLLSGQLKFMSGHFEVLAVSSKGHDHNSILKVEKEENVRVKPIEMTRKVTPFKDVIALWNLYRLFRRECPDIVHSHTPKAGTLSMLAAFLARVPHRLHTIAGLPLIEEIGMKRKTLNLVECFTYKCATRIYPNSHGLLKFIINNKFTSQDKLKVIGKGSSNGIDTMHFNPSLFNLDFKQKLRAQLGISEDDYVFVFAGRIVKDKGVNELIEAFYKLNQKFKNIKLIMIGTFEKDLDPVFPETEKIINQNKNIIFPGWVNDVRPYFSISNVLTFPSYREGFPNVVMQAAAMTLTCIVSDINGCNEIITHNKNGLVVPAKSVQGLIDAMSYTYLNKIVSKNLGVKSRENIVSNFERKDIWNSLLQEYHSLK